MDPSYRAAVTQGITVVRIHSSQPARSFSHSRTSISMHVSRLTPDFENHANVEMVISKFTPSFTEIICMLREKKRLKYLDSKNEKTHKGERFKKCVMRLD
jgi:hypothetical protein